MVYLTHEFTPSALFSSDDLAAPFQRWLEQARQQRQTPQQALPYVEKAVALGRETGDHAAQAAALVHLSDLHRQAGRPGPALSCARQAYEILRRQPGQLQRHNEAVAAYHLGLLQGQMGNDIEAIQWYLTAARLLEQAQEYWTTRNWAARLRRCHTLGQLLERLIQHTARGERDSVLMLARLIGADDPFQVVELQKDGNRLSERLTIGSQAFRLIAPVGGLTLAAGEEYCAFQLPDRACARFGAQRGDYILGQRIKGDGPSAPYVVVSAAGPDFVIHFQRDATGQVSFESLVSGRVIGGMNADDLSLYRPIALLRPEK